MSHFHNVRLASLSLAVATAGFAGCATEVATTPSVDAGDDAATVVPLACSADAGAPVVVPSTPSTAAPHDSTSRWFALEGLNFGAPAGHVTPCAWTSVALDLDHRTTNPTVSTGDSCTRAAGSTHLTLLDGPGGADDNFLGTVMPIFGSPCVAQSAIGATATVLLRVDSARDDDATDVHGALYLGRSDEGAKGHWRVDATSLVDRASLDRPIATFDAGYVKDGVLVTGPTTGTTRLPTAGSIELFACDGKSPSEIDWPITRAQLVVALDGSKGVLAGAVPVAGIADALSPALATMGICPSTSTFSAVAKTIAQAADLVGDAPDFNDPSKPCDAISLGVGVSLAPIDAPTEVVAPAAPSDPCAASK
jgi:hypothetical protein